MWGARLSCERVRTAVQAADKPSALKNWRTCQVFLVCYMPLGLFLRAFFCADTFGGRAGCLERHCWQHPHNLELRESLRVRRETDNLRGFANFLKRF